MKDFVSVHEARALIQEQVRASAVERPVEFVPLSDAVGRTLARDVISGADYPPFPSSAMDGYAVGVHTDNERTFRIVGESRAGVPFDRPLREGEAVRIATGAVVPSGTYTIVPIELEDDVENGSVSFISIPDEGSHVRPSGKDIAKDVRVFDAGMPISPSMIGMLAMLGVSPVPVWRRPRVSIVTTGDELVDASHPDPLSPGMIRDSNAPGLAAMAGAIGAEVAEFRRAADTPDALAACLSDLNVDLVLISGGVSVGPHDHVRRVLNEVGVEMLFWRVRQRPGKPLAFGMQGSVPIFALPGNPVSSAICFDQYVRPAVQEMLRQRDDATRRSTAVLKGPVDFKRGLYNFVRAAAQTNEAGVLEVQVTGAQDSNLVSSIVNANCLIHVQEHVEELGDGEIVPIEWFRY